MSRLLPTVLAALVLTLTAPAGRALDADEMFADPAQETRARGIGRQLRCLVCQNQSIFDSNAGLAKDLRVVVRERMRAGDSDDQILTYVADRFGDYVLLKPRVGARTYILWAAPLGALLLGVVTLLTYHRGRARAAAPADLTEAERDAARRLLSKET